MYVYKSLNSDLPECSEEQQLVYGAEKGEQIDASCGVNARPEASKYM